MKITKLTIKGYKRVFLSDIQKIVYTPEEKTQIILGANGCGKSTLLSQLTPLPANINKDYKENGYKIIEIEHNNKYYILHSGINGKNKHSFLVDDIELNPSGTGKVQTQLVYEHFNITPHIHQILLGNNRFTNMSLVERKKWITKISTIDYTYPITVFNKLKQRHRDIIGGIKITQENIVKMENGLLSDKELKQLMYDRDELNNFIEYVISLLSHDTDSFNLTDNLKELNTYNEQLLSRLNNKSDKTNIDLNVLKEQHEQLIKQNKKISSEIDQLDKIVDGNTNKETVVKELKELIIKKELLDKTVYIETVDMPTLIVSFENAYSDIVSVLSRLLEYAQFDSSKDNYNLLDKELRDLLTKKDIINNKLRLVDTEITNLDKLNTDENKVECPKCNNIWHLHYNKDKHSKLITDKNSLTSLLTEITKTIEVKTKYLDDIKEKRDIIKLIGNIVTSNISLKPILMYLLKDFNIHTGDVNSILSKLETISISIQQWKQLSVLDKEITDKKIALREIELSEKIKLEFKNVSSDKLKLELDQNTIKLNSIKRSIISTEEMIKKEKEIELLKEKIEQTLVTIYSGKKKYNNKIRNDHLNELITLLKEEHLEITNKLNDATGYLDKIKEDRKNLDMYNTKEKVLKTLIKELSPSEGLIAKSINSFLNVFINDINKLINTVWSYDMYLLPCEVSEGNDLDYKFRVKVNGTEIVEDISKTSSSMQEMIDLAFKIIFMKYAGLQDAPLVLDEFGKTFDAAHRVSAYATIDKIVSNKFTQLFIISHYESLYGRFNNVNINIINTDGVDTNTINKYNEVFKIT